jgi:predicted AAA+ superfamily ATPase
MKDRDLRAVLETLCFAGRKMALVSGPRQCGKTTLARMLLKRRTQGRYCNWDDVEVRRAWAKQPRSLIPEGGRSTPLVVLDEIHKAAAWKRTLKGVWDTLDAPVDFLITGSARLNVYRKGGDSLTGRYYHFRLHPFTLREMRGADAPRPDDALATLFTRARRCPKSSYDDFLALLRYSGFPEPLFAQDERRARLWRRNRVETVIREDLRDLSRIPELSRIEMLAALLPEKVGSLFSVASLRDDLEVSFDTVKRWVGLLRDLYYLYEIKPWQPKIARSIRKEGKVYLWDHAEVVNEAARFENLVANHLKKACDFWTDSGEGQFELLFIRNKEKQEIDFLVTRDRQPWLPVEVKLRDSEPSTNWQRFLPHLPCRQALQLTSERGCWRVHRAGDRELLVASAAEALQYLP